MTHSLKKVDLIKLHNELIVLYGGSQGILYDATLDFALEKSRSKSEIVEQAATLLRIIAVDHPFADGNKRTAIASAQLLLGLSGYQIEINEDETLDLILKVATKELNQKDIVRWIKSRLLSLE
jgi:death on curing protein